MSAPASAMSLMFFTPHPPSTYNQNSGEMEENDVRIGGIALNSASSPYLFAIESCDSPSYESQSPANSRRTDSYSARAMGSHTHLKADVVAGLVDHFARLSKLGEGAGDEALPAEARVHGHEQYDVDLIQDVFCVVEGRRGIEHKSCDAGGGGEGKMRGLKGTVFAVERPCEGIHTPLHISC